MAVRGWINVKCWGQLPAVIIQQKSVMKTAIPAVQVAQIVQAAVMIVLVHNQINLSYWFSALVPDAKLEKACFMHALILTALVVDITYRVESTRD